MRHAWTLLLIPFLAVGHGCSDDEMSSVPDSGANEDAQTNGTPDSGLTIDAGLPSDSGAAGDAGFVPQDNPASASVSLGNLPPLVLAVLGNGDLVAATTLIEARDFGTGTLTPPVGLQSLLVLTYSPDLTLKQSTLVPSLSSNHLRISSATRVGTSSVAVSGFLGDSNVHGDGRPFVAAIDASGAVVWSFIGQSPRAFEIETVSADPRGRFYVQGTLTGTTSLGGMELSNPTGSMVMGAFDPSGAHEWSFTKAPPPNQAIFGSGIAATASGVFATYMVGSFSNDSLVPDSVIQQLDGTGSEVWARTLTGAGSQGVFAMAAGSDGLAVAGGFNARLDFGAVQLQPTIAYDGFFARYALDGTFQSAQSFGGAGYQGCSHVAVADDGSAAVMCEAQEEFRVGGQTHTGGSGAILVRFASDDTVLWSRAIVGVDGGGAGGIDLVSAPDGTIYVSLLIPEDTDLGPGVVEGPGPAIARFSP